MAFFPLYGLSFSLLVLTVNCANAPGRTIRRRTTQQRGDQAKSVRFSGTKHNISVGLYFKQRSMVPLEPRHNVVTVTVWDGEAVESILAKYEAKIAALSPAELTLNSYEIIDRQSAYIIGAKEELKFSVSKLDISGRSASDRQRRVWEQCKREGWTLLFPVTSNCIKTDIYYYITDGRVHDNRCTVCLTDTMTATQWVDECVRKTLAAVRESSNALPDQVDYDAVLIAAHSIGKQISYEDVDPETIQISILDYYNSVFGMELNIYVRVQAMLGQQEITVPTNISVLELRRWVHQRHKCLTEPALAIFNANAPHNEGVILQGPDHTYSKLTEYHLRNDNAWPYLRFKLAKEKPSRQTESPRRTQRKRPSRP